MAGGSLGLASSTASGLDLTNIRPQVTFFRKVFKRHTNFGIETIQQSNITGTANFGNTITINIDNFASLITDMYMEFTLPPPAGTGGVDEAGNAYGDTLGSADGVVSNFKGYASYVNAVGYAIIDNIELIIDSNTIDKHTGLWFDIWNELTDPNRKEWPLIGKRVDNGQPPSSVDTPRRYYVPLQFFFNRNPGLALPIFIIGENKVKIKITFNSLINLLTFNVKDDNSTTVDTTKSISNFKFFTTFIYLENEEEMRIRNTLPAEYLIETVNRVGPITSSSNILNLTFDNPTKEFIWVFRENSRITNPTLNGSNQISGSTQPTYNEPRTGDNQPNDIFNYSTTSINTNLGYGTFDPFSTLILKIRNQNRFEQTDAVFFRTMQPYKHHSNTPGGIDRIFKKQFIYVYSFSLNPEEYQPSGSYNFGRLNDKVQFSFTGEDYGNYTLELFAVQYEYLTITSGAVNISSVPTQTYVESSIEETGGSKTASRTASKKVTAVRNEIKRRYTTKEDIPHLHVHEHAHLHKKKWSGLQGELLK